MSEREANFVTHDYFGTMPAVDEPVTFAVRWKDSGDARVVRDNSDDHEVSVGRAERDWNFFKRTLSRRCGCPIGDRVTYVDSDGDEIPIESQCEFDEAVRFASMRSTKRRKVRLIVEKLSESTTSTGPKCDGEKSRNSEELSSKEKVPMAPMRLDDGVHDYGRMQHSRIETNGNVEGGNKSDDTPPKWFTSYMRTMKDEIVEDVSKRVAKTVIEALQKNRDQYDLATSHHRVSDSDNHHDYYHEENREVRKSKRSEDNESADLCWENRNREIAVSLLADERFDEISRRRCRKNEKQQRKKSIGVTGQASKMAAGSQRGNGSPSSTNRQRSRRGGKTFSPRLSCVISPLYVETSRDTNSIIDYEKIIDSHDRQRENSKETDKSFDRVESTIRKFNLDDSVIDDDGISETKTKDGKNSFASRMMSCSVEGNDKFDRSNDRVPECCALSDSDNISIISDVSSFVNSGYWDFQRTRNDEISNEHDRSTTSCKRFAFKEYHRSMTPPINFLDDDDDDDESIGGRHDDNCLNEERENARDSSSFELLSEPPSPTLSFHMDEEHFSNVTTNDYNINDDTRIEKIFNQTKIDAINEESRDKNYQRNIVDAIDRKNDLDDDQPVARQDSSPEIILTKRTDGAYSFVGETLPGSTRETSNGTKNSDDSGAAIVEDTNEPETTIYPGNSHDSFHESTQSFHSHTTSSTTTTTTTTKMKIEDNSKDFTNFRTDDAEVKLHIFVDHNVSKGLGDTRQSSPRKQSTSSSRRSSRSSSDSTNGTRKPKRGMKNSRNFYANDGNEDFAGKHILPENLVTGAVHVATSAYCTARRVYDKILTGQTRKPTDK